MADTPLYAGPHGEPLRVVNVDPVTGDPAGIALIAGAAIIGKVSIDQTTPGTTNGVVNNAGTALMGKVGIDQTTPGTTNGVVATGNVASAAADSGNPLKVGGVFTTTPPTLPSGTRGDVQLDSTGGVRVRLTGLLITAADGVTNSSLVTSTNAADSAANNRPLTTAPYKFNGTSWDRDRKPNGVSHLPTSAASTNATVAKASAGDLFTIAGFSARASICYLHIYNKATTPTVGTDVPVLTLPLPLTAAFSFQLNGLYFATGISYGFSTGNADNDSAAIAANDIAGFNMTYA